MPRAHLPREAEGMNARPALAASALALVAALSLTGCSAIDDLVHKQSTSTFDDTGAFRDDAGVDADWVPDDATAITVRTSTVEKAKDAVILLTSATTTLPGDCVEASRTSAPSWTLDDAPSAYEADDVFVCGDWSVIPAEDGWYGWTPNSDDEKAAAAE